MALPLPGAQGAPLELPRDEEEWTVTAMRLVADRCLYGVDLNEMAVEMCKLSLWLATLAKGKPFSFLDHAIRHGDSLLGIVDVDEVAHLHLGDGIGEVSRDWSGKIRPFVERALEKRRDLLAMPTIDARDLEEKARLFAESERELEVVSTIADALIGAYLSTATGKSRRTRYSPPHPGRPGQRSPRRRRDQHRHRHRDRRPCDVLARRRPPCARSGACAAALAAGLSRGVPRRPGLLRRHRQQPALPRRSEDHRSAR